MIKKQAVSWNTISDSLGGIVVHIPLIGSRQALRNIELCRLESKALGDWLL